MTPDAARYGYLALIGLLATASATGDWPRVRPLGVQRTFLIRENAGDTPLLLYVKDQSGRSVYKFECHNGDYENEAEINFSGDFQCALFALEGSELVSGNLLAPADAPAQRSDWLNRGRMLEGQILDGCGDYPEYGVIRHFSLRAMRITFRFGDLRWRAVQGRSQPRLVRFKFSVAFATDPKAISAVAAEVRVKAPPKACYSPLGAAAPSPLGLKKRYSVAWLGTSSRGPWLEQPYWRPLNIHAAFL